ncbi:EcsC family protein [Marinobacter salicampi]|uniref:EcsC family protein n=1 Tax=Marinobacter salicampi TaxID=435907 RepID=UPI00140DFCC6|nr:EcsC family protein [Marinobacter salicampi]
MTKSGKEQKENRWVEKVKSIILDVDPAEIYQDARDAGLNVAGVEDFRGLGNQYDRVEELMAQYARKAARYCATSGAAAGFGGPVTAFTLGGMDLANLAAQLYWLNQRLAIVNGFDLDAPHQVEQAQEIYLRSLGLDAAAQATLKQQILWATSLSGKRSAGASAGPVAKIMLTIARKLSIKLTSKRATRLVPVVGGVFGAGVNYAFAKSAAETMIDLFREAYGRAWTTDHNRMIQ